MYIYLYIQKTTLQFYNTKTNEKLKSNVLKYPKPEWTNKPEQVNDIITMEHSVGEMLLALFICFDSVPI